MTPKKKCARSSLTDPNDTNAELELARLLAVTKGPAAARAELVSRINAGGKIFPLQIALAKLDFAQGNATAGVDLLKKLSASENHDDAITAKITLAQYYLIKRDDKDAQAVGRCST